MSAFFAFLRGINVGGYNKVRMADLKALFGELGFNDPQTYVQSGNVVFGASGATKALAEKIAAGFEKTFGFAVKIMVLSQSDLAMLIAKNPFADATDDPARLHAFLLDQQPSADARAKLAEKAENLSEKVAADRYEIAGKVLYLHTPDGIGRSKLAEIITRTLKVDMTARNWRTLLALAEMADDRA